MMIVAARHRAAARMTAITGAPAAETRTTTMTVAGRAAGMTTTGDRVVVAGAGPATAKATRMPHVAGGTNAVHPNLVVAPTTMRTAGTDLVATMMTIVEAAPVLAAMMTKVRAVGSAIREAMQKRLVADGRSGPQDDVVVRMTIMTVAGPDLATMTKVTVDGSAIRVVTLKQHVAGGKIGIAIRAKHDTASGISYPRSFFGLQYFFVPLPRLQLN
jgi:hypothetical protein